MKSMDVTTQIKRIKYMEQALEEASEVLRKLDGNPECCTAVRRQIEELSAYYGSEEWFVDFDSDRAGELPQDLKRGVLSQDAVYDLLMEYDRLRALVVEREKL